MSAELLVMGRHFRNRWGGVFEVLTGLLKALDRLALDQARSVQLLLPESGLELPPFRAVKPVVLPRWGGSRLLWDHVTVPAYANRRKDAVLYNPGIVLPASLRVPSIVSIHDMLYFPRPELRGHEEYLLSDRIYMKKMIARSLKRSRNVLVPTEWTRREVVRIFPNVPQNRIQVCTYGVDPERWKAPESSGEIKKRLGEMDVRSPYFLYAGGLSRRKNVGLLLEAFRRFREEHPDYRLVITGGKKRTLAEEGVRQQLEIGKSEGRVVLVGEVSHRELCQLYCDADASVYPSLYEGFGLPPLESQAMGCPVLCSSAQPMPEVVGDGALFFDPHNSDALAQAMERIIRSEVKSELIRKGIQNSSEKTWDHMALKLLELS